MGEIKANLKVGDKVEALRGFDKAKVAGEIVKIHEGENEFVDVELGNGTIEMVRASELTRTAARPDPPAVSTDTQEAAKAAS